MTTDESSRVLVVDDESAIRDLVSTTLRYEGFEVHTAATGREALDEIAKFRPDLILLDIQLPDIDGFDIQSRLRRDRLEIPVLFLTARDSTEDKVRGLTLGGDDYVTKPFSLEELVARVRAVLRRRIGAGDSAAVGTLRFAGLELDEETHRVWANDVPVELTPTEFSLLRYLLANAPRVLSKAQILDHVWDYDFDGDANVVETYISYLRKKVGAPASSLIRTVRGIGYAIQTAAD